MDGESLNILKHGWGYTCPVSTVGLFNKCYEATRFEALLFFLALHFDWHGHTILYLHGDATASGYCMHIYTY